eukprot:TRINITY_DN15179_c0_g1_i1.p1 TRINITY_DN15179_c0_g1~~TRINITY_DN15179_c0_g1_i1.p1  ORF type:complete len:341 (+),score=49.55 TRINITY_DN15179_c0_g1_i1:34-1056(+)
MLYRQSLSEFIPHVAPGSIHAERFTAITASEAYFASGRTVYSVQIQYPTADNDSESTMRKLADVRVVAAYPESHQTEIINISSASAASHHRLASIDVYGNAAVRFVSHNLEQEPKRLRCDSSSNRVLHLPASSQLADPGTCHVLLHHDETMTLTSRSSDCSLRLFAGDQLSRSANTVSTPSALTWLSFTDPVVATCECNTIALYDLRIAQPAVARSAPTQSNLYGICRVSDTSVIACGADRSTVIVDVRKGARQAVWRSCLKHTCGQVLLSDVDHDMCFVAGVDNELVRGKRDGSGAVLGRIRGDARWIGVSVCEDTLLGMTSLGSLYAVPNAVSFTMRT